MLGLGRSNKPKSRRIAARKEPGRGMPDEAARLAEEDKVFDHLSQHVSRAENRQEALIDEGLEESFPASDPPSPKHIT